MKKPNLNRKRFLHSLVFSFLIFLCLSGLVARGQSCPESFKNDIKKDTAQTNPFFFRLNNSNYFVNDEYLNDFVEGYTLIGFFVRPQLVYIPSKNLQIEAGVHLEKYSGMDKFSRVLPVVRMHYKASPSVGIVIGSLYGNANHDLPAPMFENEYFFKENIETGLQFLFDTKIYKGDIWVNWQQFIFKGDDKQEVFTLGLANRIYLPIWSKKHQISFPLRSVFVHQGGQINIGGQPVLTLNNSSAGINYTIHTNQPFLQKLSFESSFINFIDFSTEPIFPYIQGYGIYSSGKAKISFFDLEVAHWYGDCFLTPRGKEIYASASSFKKDYQENKRALIIANLLFDKELWKDVHIGAGLQTYSDLYNKTMDYGYLFYINFNQDFFIKKQNRKQ